MEYVKIYVDIVDDMIPFSGFYSRLTIGPCKNSAVYSFPDTNSLNFMFHNCSFQVLPLSLQFH